jgi:hypothetical protein
VRWPRKSRCSPSEISRKALDHGGQHGVELVLGRSRAEVHLREAFHVGLRVHGEGGQPALDLIEQIGVGRLREQRRLVVVREGGLDLRGLIGEVEHRGALLLRGSVRLSRDSVCTAFTPPSFLSTYIVWSSG